MSDEVRVYCEGCKNKDPDYKDCKLLNEVCCDEFNEPYSINCNLKEEI